MRKLLKYSYLLLFFLFLINTRNFVSAQYLNIITDSNSEIHYTINSNTNTSIKITRISGQINLIFLQNFHKQWFLKLEKFGKEDLCYNSIEYTEICSNKNTISLNDLYTFLNKPVFEDSHTLVYDYANQWTIDPEYIKANFDKTYYKENSDGSMDIELTLYFKPQSYFYLGMIISITTLILCVVYLCFDMYKSKKLVGKLTRTK